MKRKAKTKESKKIWSQKRIVVPLKVFVTPEEKDVVLQQVGDFKTVSNYIRHYIGLVPNLIGPKKKSTVAAFDVEDLGLDSALNKLRDLEVSDLKARDKKQPKQSSTKKTFSLALGEGSKAGKTKGEQEPGYFQGNLFESL